MNGRTVTNIPGIIRVIDTGNGYHEFSKEGPDALCISPKKKEVSRKLVTALGTAGIIAGVAVALILMAPGFGLFFFALLTWVLFCGWATGE